MEGIHRVALQPGNLDRGMIVAMHYAGAFAKHLDRTGLRTAAAQNIRIENAQRRTAQIARTNALDEARHVDMRGASASAGRIKTIQAAVCFNHRSLWRERRLDIAESLAQQKIVR